MKTKNKSFKRLFAFLVALVMVTALVPSVIFAADSFTDVKETDWFFEHVENLYEAGVVGGYPDGTFRPREEINRQEVAKMVAEAAGLTAPSAGFESKLLDLNKASAWAVPYIEALEEASVVKGFAETNMFRPLDTITRGHVAKMVALAFGFEAGSVSYELTDIKGYDTEAEIKLLASLGIVSGYKGTTEFRPNEKITRAEFAKIIDLAMQWEAEPEFEVVSVLAINAQEIQITFSKPVDANSAKNPANYNVTWNSYPYQEIYAIHVSLNGKVVTLRLGESWYKWDGDGEPTGSYPDEGWELVVYQFALDNGDKYGVHVSDGILSKDKSELVKRYADTQKVFEDYAAPKLLDVDLDSTDRLVLTFDEPIDGYWGDFDFAVKIDDIQVAVTATEAILDYTVKSNDPLTGDFLAKGIHNVVIYNARDWVWNNGTAGNRAAITRGSYEIGDPAAATEPYVKLIDKLDFNTFLIVFDQEVVNAKVVVNKGNTEFYNAASVSVNAPYYDEGTLVGYYHTVHLPMKAVATETSAETPLYASNATSTDLTLTVQDYKGADDLLGKKYTGTVTLNRDSLLPAALGNAYNDIPVDSNVLEVLLNRYTEDVDAIDSGTKAGNVVIEDASKITVTDKNGTPRTIVSRTIDNSGDRSMLKIVLDGFTNDAAGFAALKALAPFTVNIGAGALQVDTDFDNYSPNSKTNTLKNVSHSTKVAVAAAPPAGGAFKPVLAVQSVGVSSNVITVVYTEAMGASAAKIENYSLDDVAFPAGTQITINGSNTIVTITPPAEYFKNNVKHVLVISKNVLTADGGSYLVGNLSSKDEYMSPLLQFNDNIKPVLTKAEFVAASGATTTNTLKLTFSEDLAGSPDVAGFVVTAHDGTVRAVTGAALAVDTVTLTLDDAVNMSQTVKVKIAAGSGLTDLASNALTVGTEVTVSGRVAP